jgi:hypothetical protein
MRSEADTTTYSIEVSGWNIDAEFFVERAQLRWDGEGDKFVTLRSAVRTGSLLSVRTINASGTVGPLLMAYRAEFLPDRNSSDEKHFSVRLVPYRRSNSSNAPRNLSLDSFVGVHTT